MLEMAKVWDERAEEASGEKAKLRAKLSGRSVIAEPRRFGTFERLKFDMSALWSECAYQSLPNVSWIFPARRRQFRLGNAKAVSRPHAADASSARSGVARRYPQQADLFVQQDAVECRPLRLVSRHRACDSRPHGRPLAGVRAADRAQARQAGVLSLHRIPDRTPAVRFADQPAPARHRPHGAGQPRRRSRPAPQARARRGARQRRPRPARRLLHGQHGGARGSGLRLRHPLRAWPVHAADPRRLAARAAGAMAGVRQSVGIRAARNRIFHPVRRQRRISRQRTGRHRARPVVSRRARARRGARHADHGMARAPRQHAAALVGALDHAGAARRIQRRRSRRRDGAPRPGRGHFARALSERRHAGGTGAAAAPGVFLHLGVAAGHRPAPSAAFRRPRLRCRSMSPSSSTTRIRRSRSRS